MRSFLLVVSVLGASSCATAKLVGEPAFTPPDPGVQRTVVIEPLFELAELQTTTRTEYAQLSSTPYGMGMGGFGSGFGGYGPGYGPGYGGMGSTVAVTRTITEKPFFARPPTLTEVQSRVIREVQRRRPSWRVTSTGGASVLTGEVSVVRTIIGGDETVESNRSLKNLAFGFGLVIWPLQLYNITPVEETVRVYGLVERFKLPGPTLQPRLVKYPTQPDFAVNLAGVQSVRHEFGLDVTYDEGLLASEAPRPGVLIDGFVDRLAAAVIALVEE